MPPSFLSLDHSLGAAEVGGRLDATQELSIGNSQEPYARPRVGGRCGPHAWRVQIEGEAVGSVAEIALV